MGVLSPGNIIRSVNLGETNILLMVARAPVWECGACLLFNRIRSVNLGQPPISCAFWNGGGRWPFVFNCSLKKN